MTRELSPFTRLTLLISELNGNKIEDLSDVKKCDLSHHAAKLQEEFGNTPQKDLADQIGARSTSLLTSIGSGEVVKAEEWRLALISSCRRLKDKL